MVWGGSCSMCIGSHTFQGQALQGFASCMAQPQSHTQNLHQPPIFRLLPFLAPVPDSGHGCVGLEGNQREIKASKPKPLLAHIPIQPLPGPQRKRHLAQFLKKGLWTGLGRENGTWSNWIFPWNYTILIARCGWKGFGPEMSLNSSLPW